MDRTTRRAARDARPVRLRGRVRLLPRRARPRAGVQGGERPDARLRRGGRAAGSCRSSGSTSTQEPLEEAIRCLDRGARGIKLHPRAQSFSLADERLAPVFALAAEREVPILIHGGRGLPPIADELGDGSSERYDGVRLIVAHAGIADMAGLAQDTSRGVDGVYFDTSVWSADRPARPVPAGRARAGRLRLRLPVRPPAELASARACAPPSVAGLDDDTACGCMLGGDGAADRPRRADALADGAARERRPRPAAHVRAHPPVPLDGDAAPLAAPGATRWARSGSPLNACDRARTVTSRRRRRGSSELLVDRARICGSGARARRATRSARHATARRIPAACTSPTSSPSRPLRRAHAARRAAGARARRLRGVPTAATEPSATTTEETATDDDGRQGGVQGGRRTAAREDGGATAPTERLDPEQTLHADVPDELRRLHGHPRPGSSRRARGLARLARARRLLRRHDLPPHRARLRDPGRRPDAAWLGRPGLLDRRRAASRTRATSRASSRWPRRRSSRPARPAASSSSSPATTPGLPPDYAIVGEVTDGLDVVRRIGKLGDETTQQPTHAGSSVDRSSPSSPYAE